MATLYYIFITCIESYLKYLVVNKIPSKLNIENKVSKILQQFSLIKKLMIYNEPSFSSFQFQSHVQRNDYSLRTLDIVRPKDR